MGAAVVTAPLDAVAQYRADKARTVESRKADAAKLARAQSDLAALESKPHEEQREAALVSRQRRYARGKRMQIGGKSRRADGDASAREAAFFSVYEMWIRSGKPPYGVPIDRAWLAKRIARKASKATHQNGTCSPRYVTELLRVLVSHGHLYVPFGQGKGGRGRHTRYAPADYPVAINAEDRIVRSDGAVERCVFDA